MRNAGISRPPVPLDENERLRALRECGVLDTPPDPSFDGLTALAARLCGTPIALVSLIDEGRQWFKSRVGLDITETPREHAFCAHAIAGDGPLVITDATQDPRMRDNPLVTGEPGIRFYAGVPLRLSNGEAVGTLCVIDRVARDWTAQMESDLSMLAAQASAQLEFRRQAQIADRTEKELRVILDAVPSYIYYKDANNKIINLNKAAASAMRLPIDDVRGHQSEEFFPPADAEEFLRDDREVLESGEPKLGIVEYHEGGRGERRVISTDKFPLKGVSGEDRIVAIATDLTELFEARAELAQAQERFRRAVDGSTDGLWDYDPVTGATWYSDRFKELVGYEPDAFDSFKPVVESWYDLLHPDDQQRTWEAVEAHLRGEAPYDCQYRLRTRGGEYRWFRARGKAVYDDSGRAVRMSGSLSDISELKEVESQLEQRNDELEQFVYTASHDLKAPIVTMTGYMSYLEKDIASGDKEAVADAIERITRAVRRLETNVDDLLELSRVGRASWDPVVIDLAQAARAAVEEHRPALDEKGMSVRFDLDAPACACDRKHLGQMLSNLIVNATRYGAGASEPALTIRSREDRAGWVRVSVEDNGAGVPPAHAEKVFGLFERLSNDKEGSGIGLAIVRRTAELYAGGAWVQPAGGGGAEFCIVLPAPESPLQDPEEERVSDAYAS